MARILITSGPTRQYLDPVRYLTNASSGRMGAALAAIVAMIIALGTHLNDRCHNVGGPAVGGPSPFTPHHRFELLPIGASE